MNDQDNIFLDSFIRLLDDVSGLAAVRAVHHGGDTTAIWDKILHSGFVDALVPEAHGGGGLSRAEVAPLLSAAGRSLLPLAFGHTAVARLLIADAGETLPIGGPILLWPLNDGGTLRSQVAPAFFEAGHALVQRGRSFQLLPLKRGDAVDGFGFLAATLDSDAVALLDYSADGYCLLNWAAALAALASAGATARTIEMSLQHVTERRQFGRPLGNFQAIQHLASQAAEQSVLAGTAARMAFSGSGVAIDELRVAMAKSLTASAAADVSRIAHALHGAIGISEEHDLQLYTRQLKRWQLSFGAQAFWAERIGAARLAEPEGSSVDFIRERLAPLRV